MVLQKEILQFPKLFEFQLEISINGEQFDLHNDFICERAILNNNEFDLVFRGEDEVIVLKFKNALINQFDLFFEKEFDYYLDNFHRGKAELHGLLYEEIDGRKCFYIEFYQKGKVELLSSEVEAILYNI